MATPVYTTDGGTETNVATVSLPATIAANDFLGVAAAIDSNAGIASATDSTADAWTGSINNVPSCSACVFWKVADGDEDGGNLVIAHTGGSEAWNGVIIHIPAAEWQFGTAPAFGTWVDEATQTPNPPSVNPSWDAGETAGFFTTVISNDAHAPDPTPSSGYALGAWEDAAAGGQGCGVAYREVAADSEDPGTWDMGASATVRSQTFAIRLTQAAAAGSAMRSMPRGVKRGVKRGVHRSIEKLNGIWRPTVFPVGLDLQGA